MPGLSIPGVQGFQKARPDTSDVDDFRDMTIAALHRDGATIEQLTKGFACSRATIYRRIARGNELLDVAPENDGP
ncbi:hypothetical protein FZ103_04215 [Streptomonospora sp. PA3]|uniref:hypothetical protein n=1 Tax=Streptomonospora sp. PA3 TaxID=2607326 RepID=UPI0012DFC172|nr:hypothetical protein [Streptomonospora sp. PA3]MUL40390.1 hypothetical protein [Streptomonospora sp. PA3]